MKKRIFACIFLIAGCTPAIQGDYMSPVAGEQPAGITGKMDPYPLFPSTFVERRNVQVWLPPDYFTAVDKRFPVLYMHDGQNLWDPETTWNKQAWDVDGVMAELIRERKVRSAIVVGIDQTARRFEEYMPRKAVTSDTVQGIPDRPPVPKDRILSDLYLQFIVKELKPFIDGHYRTLPDRANTFMMGSSMGGLISAYAISEYPNVFGGIAGLSTHWPAGDGAMIRYLDRQLPKPATHRIYWDHGTQTLDAAYAPYQVQMDAVMRKHGYRQGTNWETRVFEGAAHDETSWNARLGVPLQFLLGP